MDRQVKFRGKRIDNGEWVYGDLIRRKDSFGDIVIIGSYKPDYFYDEYQVDPSTVGQFTCLKDRNGKEIFEGDILKSEFGEGYPTQIMFGEYKDDTHEETDRTTNIGFYWREEDNTTTPFGKSIDGDMNYCEVIGNIHENPELL